MRQQPFDGMQKLGSVLLRKVGHFGHGDRKHAAALRSFLVGLFVMSNVTFEASATPERNFSPSLVYGSGDLRIASVGELGERAVWVLSEVQKDIGKGGFVGIAGSVPAVDDGRQVGREKCDDQCASGAKKPEIGRSESDPEYVHPAIKLLFFVTLACAVFSAGRGVGYVQGHADGRRSKP